MCFSALGKVCIKTCFVVKSFANLSVGEAVKLSLCKQLCKKEPICKKSKCKQEKSQFSALRCKKALYYITGFCFHLFSFLLSICKSGPCVAV